MKAAAYCRVSTEDQAINGYSLEGQRDECIKHLLKRGYEEYEIYVDDGYSAKDMNRPALTRLLAAVKAKEINYIVFWALDRLTRDPIDGLLMCRETFYKNGLPFASITEELDMTTADGELMLTIRLSMARAERRRISERTKIGYAKRAQLGLRNSPAKPYGYDVGPNLVLTVNEEEKPIVLMIFQWYINGYGITKIGRELNVLGIPGPRGGKWSTVGVAHIIQNITYLGYNHWKPKGAPEEDRIIRKADHIPLVDEDLFNQAQEIIKRRSLKEMSRSSNDFYFSSILKCGLCGSSFYGNRFIQRGRKMVQYFCAGKRYHGSCTSSNISEKKVTKLVLSKIDSMVTSDHDKSKEVSTANKNDAAKQRKQIERLIVTVKGEMEKLVSLYMSDKIDLDIYELKRDQTKRRIADLEERLLELPQEENNRKLTQEATIKFMSQIQENWEYLSDAERKMVIQRLFSAIKIVKINEKWRIEDAISPLL